MIFFVNLVFVLIWFDVQRVDSIEYGRDGCCIRFGWFAPDIAAELQCPIYEHHYQLPDHVEQVQWCLTIDDMLKLGTNSNATSMPLSFFNDSFFDSSYNLTSPPLKFTFLTIDNFEECTQIPYPCGLLFLSCVMNDCIYEDENVTLSEEPRAHPTQYPTQELEPSVPPILVLDCENTFEIEQTYVEYTPLSKPLSYETLSHAVYETNSELQENEELSSFDNRQPTLRLRFLFAEIGSDPWETDIANGDTPKSPFLGQVLITLTDETQQFPGWVECDGREYNVMMYPQLFDKIGYVFGANWNDDTFMIPDCTNKILIHHSNEFIFGVTSGTDEIDITQNGILLPPHSTQYETKFMDLDEIPSFPKNLKSNENTANFKFYDNNKYYSSDTLFLNNSELLESEIIVSISENIVNYQNTVTKFNNMQKYLALNFLIVSHGKLPFDDKSSHSNSPTLSPVPPIVDDTFFKSTNVPTQNVANSDTKTTTSSQRNRVLLQSNENKIDWDHSGFDRRLYIGEIVISSNHQIPPGFVACDGAFLEISEYNQLFKVLGFKYGGNNEIGQFKLPDCRGRAFMHKVDPQTKESLVGETGGQIISEMTSESIPVHHHSQFNFISQTNVLAHVRTFENLNEKHGQKAECKTISNFMPYIVLNIAYYNGTNDDPCKKSHFLGGIGIFSFEGLPNDFSNFGLSHDLINSENNKIKNSNLMSYVSNDFVWSNDCIILPNFQNNLLSHSIKKNEFSIVCGKNTIGCDILIPHQHITFITAVDTYCGDISQNLSVTEHFHDSNVLNENDCKIGQWSEYSSCIFDFDENENLNQNERNTDSRNIAIGYQYRTRKLYVNNEISENDNNNYEANMDKEKGCSKCKNNKFVEKFKIDCECNSASREVRECSIENCLEIVIDGDRRSYFDNKWKLFDKNGVIIASGRDDGYGSKEGCIIVSKGECYKLHLYDRSGDGICCDFGSGNIRWYFENELLGFYHNNDNWFEQVIDICVPFYNDPISGESSLIPINDDCISVNITGDSDIEYENFWNIYDSFGNTVMTSSKPHIVEKRDCQCKRLKSGCYDLVLFDESGDGICCKSGSGRLTISHGNELVIDYYPKENEYFTFKQFNFCL